MRETAPTGVSQLARNSRPRSGRRPDLGEPPIARLGSMAGMPRAIFTEDDDTTLTDLVRIGRKASQIPRRASVLGSAR